MKMHIQKAYKEGKWEGRRCVQGCKCSEQNARSVSMVLGQFPLNPSSKPDPNPNPYPNQEPMYLEAIVLTPSVSIN